MERTFECLHCPGLTFATDIEQSRHRRRKHQQSVTLTFASDGEKVVVERDAETGLFCCPRCPMRYESPSSLTGHVRSCIGNQGDVIDTAAAGSDSDSDVSRQDEAAGAPLTCVHCPELSFKSDAALSYHHKYIHMHKSQATVTFASDGAEVVVQRDVQSGLFMCPRCSVGSKSQRGLSNHTKTCAAAAAPRSEQSSSSAAPAASTAKRYYCLHCPELVFDNSGQYSRHCTIQHQNKATVKFGIDGAREESHRDPETRKFTCPRCPYSTEASGALHCHTREWCKAPPKHSSAVADGNDASSSSAPLAPLVDDRTYVCKRCPELIFPTRSTLLYHHQIQHVNKITLNFSDGDAVVVERDAATTLFSCPRCPKTSQPPSTMQKHVKKCLGTALQQADGSIDSSVDHAALKDAELVYVAAYGALCCIPCGIATTIGRLPEHWVTPTHQKVTQQEGVLHDVDKVRRALGVNVPITPALLATPDPYGPALDFLSCTLGYRCTACTWVGKHPHSQGHWNDKHAEALGEMPAEMDEQVKMQRWNFHNAYFDVERKPDAICSEQQKPAASQVASAKPRGPRKPRVSKSFAAAMAASSSSLASASQAAPAVASSERQSRPETASTGASRTSRKVALPASPVAAPSRVPQVKSGSTAKAVPRPAPRARKAASLASSASSVDSDIETASDSSVASWEAGRDWDANEDDASAPDFDTYEWEVGGEDEDEEWIDGSDVDRNAAALNSAFGSSASPQAQAEGSGSDESDWEGPMVIIELPRKARTRSDANAGEREEDTAALPRSSVSAISATRSSHARSSGSQSLTLRRRLSSSVGSGSSSSLPPSPSTHAGGEFADLNTVEAEGGTLGAAEQIKVGVNDVAQGAAPSSFAETTEDQLPALQVAQQSIAQPPQQQVASFFSSLLSLVSSVLAPQRVQHPSANPESKEELEASRSAIAGVTQAQHLLASTANEPSDSARSMPLDVQAGLASSSPSPTLGSLATSRSSWMQPESSLLPQHRQPQSTAATSGSNKGKQRMLSPAPVACDREYIGSKKRKMDDQSTIAANLCDSDDHLLSLNALGKRRRCDDGSPHPSGGVGLSDDDE